MLVCPWVLCMKVQSKSTLRSHSLWIQRLACSAYGNEALITQNHRISRYSNLLQLALFRTWGQLFSSAEFSSNSPADTACRLFGFKLGCPGTGRDIFRHRTGEDSVNPWRCNGIIFMYTTLSPAGLFLWAKLPVFKWLQDACPSNGIIFYESIQVWYD